MARDLRGKRITAAWLRRKRACGDQVQRFEAEWPTGAELTEDNVRRAVALGLDIGWFISHLNLPAPARRAYDEATAPARRAYDEAMATARRAFHEAMAPARRAYDEATAPAQRAFHEAMAPAQRAYDEAMATWLIENVPREPERVATG